MNRLATRSSFGLILSMESAILISSGVVRDCCTIASGPKLECKEDKELHPAPADHFDLGSEGWYRQKQVVWLRLYLIAYFDALCMSWPSLSVVAIEEFHVIRVQNFR
jgi:hypothetical protein